MTRLDVSSFSVVYEGEFIERRKQLRQRRRVRLIRRIWQLLFISSVTGSMLWVATLPDWLLRSPSQIDIEGNRLLAKEAIKKLVPISYPQSIFQVQPQLIATKLESLAPVHNVIVTRTLFPSRLTIQLKERDPVANATLNGKSGLIDADGTWTPLQSYPPNIPKPELTVLGFSEQNAPQWSSLYRQVNRSSVKISQIDWRDTSNLIVTTEVGMVHCGSYLYTDFAKQLATLDQLRTLPKRLNPNTFTYIDLTDPKAPVIEMHAPSRVKLNPSKP